MPEYGSMQGLKVLVTGATGFIGGRLVEKLVLEEGAAVQALVRHYGHAARLARFDVEMIGGSLQDAEAIERAVADADIVFNLAYITSNSAEENVVAIGDLIDACLRHRVQRLVHLSTFAVYQPFPEGDIDAETPVGSGAYGYPQAKIAVEKEILAAVRGRGLDAVILRPSIVYGPFGGYWTDRQVKNLIKGRMVLPEPGDGLCNAVFVDDLVDATMLAATAPQANGEVFLISGPDTVTWKNFYERLQECIGVKTLRFRALQPASPEATTPAPTSKNAGLKASARRQASKLASRMSKDQKRRLRRTFRRFLKRGSKPVGISTDFDFTSKPVCRIDKARSILGYDPKFDFEAGMAATCEYLRWAYPQAVGELPGINTR